VGFRSSFSSTTSLQLIIVTISLGLTAGCEDSLVARVDQRRLTIVTETGVVIVIDGPPTFRDSSGPGKNDLGKRDKGSAAQDRYVGPKPDTSSPLNLTSYEKDLFDAINTYRGGKGLSTFTAPDPLLLCAARRGAEYCCYPETCHHDNCRDGTNAGYERVTKCGGTSAEASKSSDIGAGPGWGSGTQVVNGWAGDAFHAAILNRSEATKVGVGGNEHGCYWAVFDVYPPSG
jgi:uncharacterized protein YkwD